MNKAANENAGASSETIRSDASSSSRGIKWWKRVTPRKRRRPMNEEPSGLDQEMYMRSILESWASSMSSKTRYSTSNLHLSMDTKSIRSSKTKWKRAVGRRLDENETGKMQPYRGTNTGKLVVAADSDRTTSREKRDSGSPAYMEHLTPNGDAVEDMHHVDIGDHNAQRLGSSSDSNRRPYHEEMDDKPSSDEEARNKRRLQRRMKIGAVRARSLEKKRHRARARKKICVFIACIGVTLTAFVVVAIFIAHVGVEVRTSSLASSSENESGSVSSGSSGLEADLSVIDSSATASTDGPASLANSGDKASWSLSIPKDGSGVSSNTYTYIHCILMVLSLWMSLVVVIMHVTFQSFRTYSHPFVLELNCVQCGYWITTLLRVMLETAALTSMTYLIFCMFECFFNFAQISFTCAIAFNMYRSVVSYADVLMDSQSSKRRYYRYTMNVLLLSIMAAVTLALVGDRFNDMYEHFRENDNVPPTSLPETEDKILDEEIFSPCLYPTCRLILYVYYPLLAFGFNFIFYMRFKRTIGRSYPTSATGRLNKVARSYLIVFFGCWGSLILLTVLKVLDSEKIPTMALFVLQSIFDISSVCTAAITFTNFHRCRKAFDFGLSLKAIDPNSIEFDDPVNIVGEGTFAIVLKARWRQGGHIDGAASRSVEVAVKTFKQAQMECLEHIKEEAYLSSKLEHPCVMMTYGCYTSGINLYIVYEYLGGGTLQDVIDAHEKTPFSYKRGLRYAHMIAMGMRFLHGLPVPIVHRDLKPLNCIFDSKQEMLKVADFGESRLLRTRDEKARRPRSFPSADATVQMTTNIGSACWAAPEVLKEEATSEYSVKIDVYSFGIICWQLSTCALPYADIPGSVLAVAEAVLSGVRPAIPQACPRVFTRIMKRCWHENPLRRPSFEDIVQLLEIELTEEQRRQLVRIHGTGNDSGFAPPTLDSRNVDNTGGRRS